MKKYATLIIEIQPHIEDNKLIKNINLFFVQENKEVIRHNTSDLGIIREFNELGWFVSAVDADSRQFIMTKEL